MPARKTKTVEKSVTLLNPAAAVDPELSASAKRMLQRAQSITVATAEDYEAAAVVLQTLGERESEVEAKKKELWAPLAKAEKFQDSGNYERAHVLEARAQSVQAPTIESETPKVAGVSLREHWLFEVTDAALVPREYLIVDERLVRADVTGSKGTKEIPGVRVWSELRPQG